jgi:probable phosphoglycerate mutase
MPFARFKIYTDGGSRGNPGPAAASAIIQDDAGIVRGKCGKYLGPCTNNVAEYFGVIIALEKLKEMTQNQEQDQTCLDFFLDSLLVVNQLTGKFKIKDLFLQKLAVKTQRLAKGFSRVSYQYIPREQNREADALVNLVLDQAKRETSFFKEGNL